MTPEIKKAIKGWDDPSKRPAIREMLRNAGYDVILEELEKEKPKHKVKKEEE